MHLPFRRSRTPRAGKHSHPVANSLLAVGVVAAVVMTTLVLRTTTSDDVGEDLTGTVTPEARPTTSEPPTEVDLLQGRIQDALDADAFPTLEPDVGSLGYPTWAQDAEAYGCLAVTPENLADCRFGDLDSKRTAVLLGDSFAVGYLPAVREALADTFAVQQVTLPECPAFDAATDHFDGTAFPECGEFRAWAIDQVALLEPDLVLLSSNYTYAATSMTSGATGEDALDEVEAGLERTVDAVSAPDRLVAVLAAPPGSGNLQSCVTASGTPSDCERRPTPDWEATTDLEERVADRADAEFVETADWFCDFGQCPAFVDTTPVYADGVHLTKPYARDLGPVMLDALAAAASRYRKRNPVSAGPAG